jgi:hypothetical protein
MRAKFVPEPVRFVNVRIELELRPNARVGRDLLPGELLANASAICVAK